MHVSTSMRITSLSQIPTYYTWDTNTPEWENNVNTKLFAVFAEVSGHIFYLVPIPKSILYHRGSANVPYWSMTLIDRHAKNIRESSHILTIISSNI